MASAKKRRTKPFSNQQEQRFHQATRLHTAGQLDQAESLYRSLVAEKTRVPHLYYQLGQVCAQTARPDEAVAFWRKTLKLDPGFHQARYLIGNHLKSIGKLEEAETCYREVIRQQPAYTQAHYTYAAIHRYADATDPHIGVMRRLYRDTTLNDDSLAHLAFGLAKAHEDIADYDAAFSYLEAGNRLRSRTLHYDISADRDLIGNIIDTFSEQAVNAAQAETDPSDRPIFIVGMPRSGTSLVEKILSSHADVHGAGELQDFYALAARDFLDPEDRYRHRPLGRCPPQFYGRLARDYLARLRAIAPDARRVTDKLPFNILMLGLIRLALPNAVIVHCLRDARDTGLSLYKQNFTTTNYRFAYDLRSIGQFYSLYRKLASHWRRVFPTGVYEVNYESLTTDPEREIPALLAACGLDWDERCLAFHDSAGTVLTASAAQVRRPIYRSSVGLWKQYAHHLGPMLRELDAESVSPG